MSLSNDSNFISLVIYGNKNIQKTIEFIQKLDGYCSNVFSKYEFVIVNDSVFSSSDINGLQELKLTDGKQLNIVNMSFHQGLEKAMNAGVDFSIGDYVFEFDTVYCDYDLSEISNVYSCCLTGADIVSAGSGKSKYPSSRLFYKLFNKYSYNRYDISSNSFFLLSRRAINRINSMSLSIPYRKAVYSNCGLNYENYQYTRVGKKRKDDFRRDKRLVISDSLVLYTNVFFKVAFTFTILMIIGSIASLTYTLVIYFTKNPTEGWTTMMLFLSIGFTAVFIFICVILIYLRIIVGLLFQKQKYLVESVKKGNKE